MDSTKASDTRKLCCYTFYIRQPPMETRSRGEPVPHVTGPEQCHTARLQNHRPALRKLEVEGSNSLPGSALTGPLGRSYARPLHAGQSACYRHLGSLPTRRGGQRKANGAAVRWVKLGPHRLSSARGEQCRDTAGCARSTLEQPADVLCFGVFSSLKC